MLLSSVLLVILMIYGGFRQQCNPLRSWYWPALFLRIVAGTLLGYLYWQQGAGDTIQFHRQAMAMADFSLTNYWQEVGQLIQPFESFQGIERQRFFVRIISLLYAIGANYWVAAAFLSFFSFITSFWLAGRLVSRWPSLYWPALLAWLLWPSVVFWGSGLLKDSLSLGCIALCVGLVLPHFGINKKHPTDYWMLLWLIPACWIIWQLKYYVAIALFICLPACWLIFLLQEKFRIRSSLVFFAAPLMGLALLLVISQLHPNLWLNRLPAVLLQQYKQSAAASAPGTYKVYPAFTADWFSLLLHVPPAALVGLFGPLNFATDKLWVLIASLENLVLLMLSGWNLLLLRRQANRQKVSIILLIVLVYVLLLAAAFGIASPNYGSLVRYKIAYLPFFVMLLLIWPGQWLATNYLAQKNAACRQGESGLGKPRFSRTFAPQK